MYELRINRLRGFLHWLVLALALGALTPAFAAFPPPGGQTQYLYGSSAQDVGAWASTQMAACQSWAAVFNARLGWQVTVSPTSITSNDHCLYSYVYKATGVTGSDGDLAVSTRIAPVECPAGSTGTTSCVCTPPSVENAAHDGCTTVNPDDERCKAIKTIAESTLGGSTESVVEGYLSSGFACNTNVSGVTPGRGCGMQMNVSMKAKDRVTGKWSTYFTYTHTGSSCTPEPTATDTSPTESTSTTPPVTPNNSPCPPGKSVGSAVMNGTTVTTCSDPIETKSEPKKETVKQNPGTPEETKTETTTETTCTGNSCNTTTTVTNTSVNGSTTSSSSSKTEGKDSFCTKNPKDGNCTGTGDVGCSKGGGTAGCTGLGKPTDGELPTKEIDVNTFAPDNMNGFSIGNGCPADLNFEAFGKSFKLSYKWFCDVAPYVKPFVLLSAAMAALMIVYAALTTKN